MVGSFVARESKIAPPCQLSTKGKRSSIQSILCKR